MGGAVGGLIAVVIVIAVVVIALLVIKKSQKGSLKVNDKKESVQGYNNALYDGKQNTQTAMMNDIYTHNIQIPDTRTSPTHHL